MFSTVLKKYNTLDILMNNAGICRNVPILDISVDEWGRYLKINLKSVFLYSKEAFKIMKEKRYGVPEDVAEVALFLASDKSNYITGEIIDLNGGLIMD